MLKQTVRKLSVVLASGIAFAAGLIGSRLLSQAVGFSVPRMPTQAPESIAVFYLISGSIVLSTGLAPLASGTRASPLVRWFGLAAFLFLAFGVSTTIETSIFTSAAGAMQMIPILLLPCVLLAGVQAVFLSSSSVRAAPGRVKRFFRTRSWLEWTYRLGGAIASFPLIYFLFGLIVSPIVQDYYANGVSGLALPAPALILQVQLLRSAIHLVSVLPLVVLWKGRRGELVIALASALLVSVFAYDIVLANQTPTVLVLVHGIEVLADSLVYAWIVVLLLVPGSRELAV